MVLSEHISYTVKFNMTYKIIIYSFHQGYSIWRYCHAINWFIKLI